MANIYLIRHGQAAANWNEDLDPPLSELGRQQAQHATGQLMKIQGIEQFHCISSPIKRAYQTAEIFSHASGLNIQTEKRVAEIPSPIEDVQERMPWLVHIMKDSWPNLSPALNQWRQTMIEYICALEHDSIIFSHYIAINVLIGYCQNSQQVISFNPANCSIHHFSNQPEFEIIQLGTQANSHIH